MKKYFTPLVFTVVVLAFLSMNCYAQDTLKSQLLPKIEYSFYGGKLFMHHEEMKEMGKTPYFGQELRVGLQTAGGKYWQQLYNYPTFGLGFYSGYFNNDVLGNPLAGFVYIDFPFARNEKQYFNTNWGIGAAFNLNEYDSITNPTNIAIGSDVNVYVNFGISYRRKLTERLEGGLGIKFQHFSNGATKHPNLGLNMGSVTATLAYYPGKTVAKYNILEKPKFVKSFEYYGMFAAGINAKSEKEPDVKYYNSTLSLGVNKKLNFKRAVGVGVDIFYNEYIKDEYDNPDSVPTSDLMSYAMFMSTDMIVNKFRIAVQLGFYTWRSTDYSQPFYERVALRYYYVPWSFFNVSIKAHAFKAQYIEWGIGFAI